MVMKSLQERQFFNPDLSYPAESEHGTRFFTIATLEYESDRRAFETLYPDGDTGEKLKAIECLSQLLNKCKEDQNIELLGEFFLATYVKKYYATEDVEVVSQAFSGLIVRMFEAAKGLDIEWLQNDKRRLINYFIECAQTDYKVHHPRSEGVPNKRAEALLRELTDVDPGLLDVAKVAAWTIYKRVPCRMNLLLTRNGKPYQL